MSDMRQVIQCELIRWLQCKILVRPDKLKSINEISRCNLLCVCVRNWWLSEYGTNLLLNKFESTWLNLEVLHLC